MSQHDLQIMVTLEHGKEMINYYQRGGGGGGGGGPGIG